MVHAVRRAHADDHPDDSGLCPVPAADPGGVDGGRRQVDGSADSYHLHADDAGHIETLIAKALASYRGDTSGVLVATKGGHLRPGDGSWTVNGSPEHLKRACEASLRRLGVEAIGLYQHHRPDPRVPYADSIGAIRDLLDAAPAGDKCRTPR